jgi:hypothetical protein
MADVASLSLATERRSPALQSRRPEIARRPVRFGLLVAAPPLPTAALPGELATGIAVAVEDADLARVSGDREKAFRKLGEALLLQRALTRLEKAAARRAA